MLRALGLVGVVASPRYGSQALVGDGPATRLAQAVRPRVEPGERVVDLLEQLEIVLRLGDAIVVLDGRLGQVGRVAWGSL